MHLLVQTSSYDTVMIDMSQKKYLVRLLIIDWAFIKQALTKGSSCIGFFLIVKVI